MPLVEYILNNSIREIRSRTSQFPMVYGRLPEGVLAVVVFQEIDKNCIYPITAYPVEE